MIEYLIFIKLGTGLATAILTAIVIWQRKGTDTIDKPIELEGNEYAIPKPDEDYMADLEHDEIRTTINKKTND